MFGLQHFTNTRVFHLVNYKLEKKNEDASREKRSCQGWYSLRKSKRMERRNIKWLHKRKLLFRKFQRFKMLARWSKRIEVEIESSNKISWEFNSTTNKLMIKLNDYLSFTPYCICSYTTIPLVILIYQQEFIN